MQWSEMGRFLVLVGAVIAAIGFIFLLADKIPLGRLPGDVNVSGGNFKISIPVTTCVLVSIVITLVVNFVSK